MVLDLLQYDAELDDPNRRNFDSIRELIRRCHEEEGAKTRLLSQAALLVRSLYRAGVIRMRRDTNTDYLWAVVASDLQWDFSLHQALSLFLVQTLDLLNPESEDYVFDVITLVESVLEDPDAILRKQVDKLKGSWSPSSRARGSSTRSAWSASRKSPIPSRSPTSSTAPTTASAASTPGCAART